MKNNWIKNYKDVAINENRKLVLDIVNHGLDSINTKGIIKDNIKLENNILYIQHQSFDLSLFDKIKVVGFGKSACDAALALEEILGEKIKEGAIVGLNQITCHIIESFKGTHPKPSSINIAPGKRIYELLKDSKENDLIITIVSGGGSALLCYPENECIQGEKLYETFLKSGQTIVEINTIRKHLSLLKGGGIAKLVYPATLIGLIFSDVPGDNFEEVASGPTYKDNSTILDAQNIIDKYNLGDFELNETPKEDKYFEKVYNFVLVDNKTAILNMKKKVEELGLKAHILSTDMYANVEESIKMIFNAKEENTVVLGAGEPKLKVVGNKGSGGRNLYMSLKALQLNHFHNDTIFISLASDGMDNGPFAGALADSLTLEEVKLKNINIDEALENFDAETAFRETNNLIITGPTGANVSDLMILFNKKNI